MPLDTRECVSDPGESKRGPNNVQRPLNLRTKPVAALHSSAVDQMYKRQSLIGPDTFVVLEFLHV